MAVVAVVEATARQLRTPKPECGDCPACASLGSIEEEVACLPPPPCLAISLWMQLLVYLDGQAGMQASQASISFH